MNYYVDVLKKYVEFNGRARRKEYWMFALINIVIMIAIAIVENVAGIAGEDGSGLISNLYSLAVLLPSLAVGARRLHDIGKSGWWLLINFIPIIGWIWILVYFCRDSQPGDNEYGPNPKGAAPMAPTPIQIPTAPPTA